MKYLLLILFFLLIAASVVTAWRMPNAHEDVPVITWVTDNNPARVEQVSLFQKWLKDNNGPVGKLVLDVSNADNTKKIVQSVSGVGSDVMDLGGDVLTYFTAIGFLSDVTDSAKELHYDLSKTYPALEADLSVRDANGEAHQYLFPCNVNNSMYVVNRDTFRQFGQPLPPLQWTLDEFEQRGKAYAQAANPPGHPAQHFFVSSVNVPTFRRSMGVSDFDETQTHCTLDDPNYADLLTRIARWRTEHIVPTRADEASFATGTGYGGASTFLFEDGHYAMLFTGRYMVIQFRVEDIDRAKHGAKPLDLTVVELPNGGFPLTMIGTRACGVYKATKDLRLATFFQAFLASKEYNDQIIRDGDGLPPDPSLTDSEAFRHPAEDSGRGIYKETEWDFHSIFADAAKNISVGNSYSPFVLSSVVESEDGGGQDLFLESGQLTAMDAVKRIKQRVDAEMQRNLLEDPTLKKRYDDLCERQNQIDALKAAGKKIPLNWILDPFRRAYDQKHGMTE